MRLDITRADSITGLRGTGINKKTPRAPGFYIMCQFFISEPKYITSKVLRYDHLSCAMLAVESPVIEGMLLEALEVRALR